MEKAEMKRLAAEVVRFIRPTPGCITCGKEPTQMCGKCFGRIRHKLPLTEEQQTRIRDIEYEAKNQIHKKRILINFYSFIWGILFFCSILFVTEKKHFLSNYISKVESTFLIALTLILHLLSYVLFLGAFCQSINLFFLKRDLKYKRTIEDENYY